MLKRDPRFRNRPNHYPDWKHVYRFLRQVEHFTPALIIIATAILFVLLIINPGTLLALAVTLLVLALFALTRRH